MPIVKYSGESQASLRPEVTVMNRQITSPAMNEITYGNALFAGLLISPDFGD